MGFYLQVGDVLLADGTSDASGYSLTGHPSFPEPAPDGFDGHLPAVRSFSVRCTGSTSSAAAYRATVLRRECVRDKRLYFRHGASGDVLECRIREGRCTEAEYMPAAREGFGVTLDVALETDPYWLGAWSVETSASASVTAPVDSFDIADPGGEVDALLSIRCVPTTSGTLLAIGVKPEPNASYTFLDDYSGVADTSMLGGSGSAILTASAAYAPVGTAPDISTNDCRGRHLMLARVDACATSPTTVYLRGRVTTTGNAIATSVSVDETAVACSASALTVYELGDVVVPAGRVPDIDTGTGYGTESVDASSSTASAYYSPPFGFVRQSFPVALAGLHAGFTVKVQNSGTASTLEAFLFTSASDTPVTLIAQGNVAVPATASGDVKVEWGIPPTVTAREYIVELTSGAAVSYYRSTASAYASGKMWDSTSSVPSASADLYFLSHIQLPLGFTTTNPVHTAQAGASGGIQVDYIARVPVDYAAVVYRDTGVMGMLYDADTDTPYDADADGIGPALYDRCEIRKPLRARPGVTNRVIVAVGQGDEATAGVDVLTYKTRPRFLTAAG